MTDTEIAAALPELERLARIAVSVAYRSGLELRRGINVPDAILDLHGKPHWKISDLRPELTVHATILEAKESEDAKI